MNRVKISSTREKIKNKGRDTDAIEIKARNQNFEIPVFQANPKDKIVTVKIQNKSIIIRSFLFFLFWSFVFQSLKFVSNFVLRISNFKGCAGFFKSMTHPCPNGGAQ